VTSRRLGSAVVWARRLIQGFCLALFLYLLLGTRTRGEEDLGEAPQLFFDLDPLALVGTWIAAHAVPVALLASLSVLALTLVFGRVFCGWICPMGTVHAMGSWFRSGSKKALIESEAWTRWQRGKYYFLITLLVMALFGVSWIGFLDPFSFLYRSTVVALLPATQDAVEDGSTVVYHTDPHLGPFHLTSLTEPVYRFFRDRFVVVQNSAYSGSALVFLLFVAAVLLNLYRKRFWCRYICPLGALLGVFSQRPLFRLETQADSCIDCGLCHVDCQGAAAPDRPGRQLPAECFVCWNCVPHCKSEAIRFRFVSPLRKETTGKLDLSKRALLGAGAAAVGGVFLSRLSPQAQGRMYNPSLIRPPGALPEREFLQRCIACGLCMKVCPTNGLHPTLLQAGLDGLWTPQLIPQIGYCEQECNLCGQVCPTGAIEPLTVEEKKKVKIGLATIDTNRCLPYAYQRECIICEEHCPVATKAIYFIEKEIQLRDGTTRVLKQPRVDPDLCTGCGICEAKCVFKDLPAIRVTSAGETRHPDNQPILTVGSRDADIGYGDETGASSSDGY
jgi:MauM/NapG family ferredoxin protein